MDKAEGVGDGGRIGTEIDVSETARANLAADAVFVTDAKVLRRISTAHDCGWIVVWNVDRFEDGGEERRRGVDR